MEIDLSTSAKNFEDGQVWSIAEEEPWSKLSALILKIEVIDAIRVVRIAIVDQDRNSIIEHLPFEITALENSVFKLHGEVRRAARI